ncbi:ER lumen protein-retaining receptor KdelR [Acrasis kona]|uniref:ER lumen protein-retaining receptor KdelR n=1 Tax=Acrasis kona TaxID=1008807 RepID=A0AAW2Z7F5_9EUKA
MMNIFRTVADLLHLLSTLILLYKMYNLKSCSGVSLKTQELYLLVFITRYTDIFHYINLYLTVMKIFYLVSAAAIVYLMNTKYRSTYDAEHDKFPIVYLLVGSLVASLIFCRQYSLFEILWTFSLFLESVAVLPQLFLLNKIKRSEAINSHYLFALGGYRALYLVNWIYRYFAEGYTPYAAWIAGAIQTALYADFLYIYIKAAAAGKIGDLPL